MAAARYSRWDGTQEGEFPDPQEVFSRLSEDVFHGWDFDSALRRLLSQGFEDDEGRRLPGLENVLEKLHQRRQAELERYNLEGLFHDIDERLDRILQRERKTLLERRESARGNPSEKLIQKAMDSRTEKLDRLPPEAGSAIRELQEYEFVDQAAEKDFHDLLQELRRNLVESHFQRLGEGMQNLGPAEQARVREMVHDLNEMLLRRLEGGPDGYQEFMDKWGAMFPDHPDNLDDFLAQLQRQMAELGSLMQSMSPEARSQFEEMMSAALSDPGLQGELARLQQLMGRMAPGGSAGNRFGFFGGEELSFPEAMQLMDRLQTMEELERAVRGAYDGRPLTAEQRAGLERELGPGVASGLQGVQLLLRELERSGELRRGRRGVELTPQGVRRIGQKALGDVFKNLTADRFGAHARRRPGLGSDPADESKPFEFGDPFRLDVERTVMNALRRGSGPPPVRLQREDFEVLRSEQTVQSATVLMLDMSRSMPLRGYFYAAKKMALALDSLIRTQFPRDTLHVVGFSDYAREIAPGALAQLSYSEYVYGTNLQHGLMLARRLLARHRGGTRQIIIVSDGEPTAHMEGDRAVFFYPPLPETFHKTLLEVRRCTDERIVINTFMLESNSHLVQFVKQLTRLNHGRAFFVSPDRLGDYVLLDYVSSRSPMG